MFMYLSTSWLSWMWVSALRWCYFVGFQFWEKRNQKIEEIFQDFWLWKLSLFFFFFFFFLLQLALRGPYKFDSTTDLLQANSGQWPITKFYLSVKFFCILDNEPSVWRCVGCSNITLLSVALLWCTVSGMCRGLYSFSKMSFRISFCAVMSWSNLIKFANWLFLCKKPPTSRELRSSLEGYQLFLPSVLEMYNVWLLACLARSQRISWTEESERLQSIWSHRVGHDWSDLAHVHTCSPTPLTFLF